jgi:phage shock protein A
MANLFKRIFSIGSSEAHSALDKLEDPIKMTEEGIRDMKKELQKSLEGLAEVKALVIRAKNELQTETSRATEYEKKALQLLQKAEAGQIDAADAERLATEALKKKEHHATQAGLAKASVDKYDASVQQLDSNVSKLRSNISSWENELKTLKARVKVSSAQKNINKHLANIDSSSTINMLERMKDKVAKDEALAESYAEIADGNKSIDDEINGVLNTTDSSASVQSDLDRLKAQLKNK